MNYNIKIVFNYESKLITILGKSNEKMKDIYQRFFNKAGGNLSQKKIFFSYNGKWGNDSDETKDLTFLQMANKEDKERKQMDILVVENTNKEKDLIVPSKEVICPQCGKYILMDINNYKISLYGCENGHTKNDILLNEFENTQLINFSKITCDICGKKRSNIFENEMDRCLNCKKNLCPLCKSSHNKSHSIIKYEQINYTCEDDIDSFTGYCQQCKKHFCMSCEDEHIEHNIVEFKSIIPKKKELENSLNLLKKSIEEFNDECQEIINVINNVKESFNIYYNIQKRLVENFDIRNQKNYFIFSNLNKIKNNDEIIEDINNIKNEVSLENKFNYIINIYNEINNTNKINPKLTIDLSKENEELRRKCLILKQSLEEAKSSQEEYCEIEKNYNIIKKIIFAGIDKNSKISKYNMANKCLLTELVLSNDEDTKFIGSQKVADVMLEVDRGDFAPNNYYLNRPIYIGYNVTISAPHMHAFALEHLAPFCKKGAKILDIGSGSGYLTVALSKMTGDTGQVVGVEHIPELYEFGIQNVKKHHSNLIESGKIIFVNADGRKGYKKYGPYKVIHAGAASEELPQEIIEQLDYNGRMFIPIGPKGETQNIYLIDKDKNGKITYRSILSVCYGMLQDKETQLQDD